MYIAYIASKVKGCNLNSGLSAFLSSSRERREAKLETKGPTHLSSNDTQKMVCIVLLFEVLNPPF